MRLLNQSPWIVLLLLVLASAVSPSCAGTRPTKDHDRAAIEALLQELESANNSGDVDRWVALFAPDFVYMVPGAPSVTTRAELAEVARAGFRHRASIRIVPAEIHVVGDWAFSRNDVTGTVRLEGTGDEVSVDVKELAIFERVDRGPWRLARLIINSNT